MDTAIEFTPNLPAPRFPQFMEAYEKMLRQAQEAAEKAAGLVGPYDAVCKAINAMNLPHEVRVSLDKDGVHVSLKSLKTDSLDTYRQIVSAITWQLFVADVRKSDEAPTLSTDASYSCSASAYWQSTTGRVLFSARIDEEGTDHIFVVKSTEATSFDRFRLVLRGRKPAAQTIEHTPTPEPEANGLSICAGEIPF